MASLAWVTPTQGRVSGARHCSVTPFGRTGRTLVKGTRCTMALRADVHPGARTRTALQGRAGRVLRRAQRIGVMAALEHRAVTVRPARRRVAVQALGCRRVQHDHARTWAVGRVSRDTHRRIRKIFLSRWAYRKSSAAFGFPADAVLIRGKAGNTMFRTSGWHLPMAKFEEIWHACWPG
jgi:hypothetical protein